MMLTWLPGDLRLAPLDAARLMSERCHHCVLATHDARATITDEAVSVAGDIVA